MLLKYAKGTEDILKLLLPKVKLDIVKVAVDLGAGDGLTGNNIAYLVRHCGWKGYFIDKCKEVETIPGNYINWFVHVRRVFLTCANVNKILPEEPFDLLSIDIDGNDYWIWKAIERKPAIVIIEFNPHHDNFVISYQEDFDGTKISSDLKYYGASKDKMIELGREKGYKVMGEESVNLFFVREDCLKNFKEECL